jgi:hypothetical protein
LAKSSGTDPVLGRVLFKLDDYVLLRVKGQDEVEAIPRSQVAAIVEGGQK